MWVSLRNVWNKCFFYSSILQNAYFEGYQLQNNDNVPQFSPMFSHGIVLAPLTYLNISLRYSKIVVISFYLGERQMAITYDFQGLHTNIVYNAKSIKSSFDIFLNIAEAVLLSIKKRTRSTFSLECTKLQNRTQNFQNFISQVKYFEATNLSHMTS